MSISAAVNKTMSNVEMTTVANSISAKGKQSSMLDKFGTMQSKFFDKGDTTLMNFTDSQQKQLIHQLQGLPPNNRPLQMLDSLSKELDWQQLSDRNQQHLQLESQKLSNSQLQQRQQQFLFQVAQKQAAA